MSAKKHPKGKDRNRIHPMTEALIAAGAAARPSEPVILQHHSPEKPDILKLQEKTAEAERNAIIAAQKHKQAILDAEAAEREAAVAWQRHRELRQDLDAEISTLP